jgi:hypothetical protein
MRAAVERVIANSNGEPVKKSSWFQLHRCRNPFLFTSICSPAMAEAMAAKIARLLNGVVLRAKQLQRVYGLKRYMAAIAPRDPKRDAILRFVSMFAVLTLGFKLSCVLLMYFFLRSKRLASKRPAKTSAKVQTREVRK